MQEPEQVPVQVQVLVLEPPPQPEGAVVQEVMLDHGIVILEIVVAVERHRRLLQAVRKAWQAAALAAVSAAQAASAKLVQAVLPALSLFL